IGFMRENLGLNLFSLEGSSHLRRRQLMMPAFHSARLSSYANVVVAVVDAWANNQPASFQTDIREAMMDLTATIVGKALFNVDLDDILHPVRQRLNEIVPMIGRYLLPLGPLLLRLPLPSHRRYHRAREEFDRLMQEVLKRHTATAE